MLQSIYAIGKEISKGRDPWLDIIAAPYTDAKDEQKRLYALEIHFDLDTGEVTADKNSLYEYVKDEELLKKWGVLSILPARNRAIYVACDASKLEQLCKSLFGKTDERSKTYPEFGDLFWAINTLSPELSPTPLVQSLSKIPRCRDKFLSIFKDSNDNISIRNVSNVIFAHEGAEKKGRDNERIVIVFASVTCHELELYRKPLRDVEGYEKFIEKKFFSTKDETEDEQANSSIQKICYASGVLKGNVKVPKFTDRNSLTSIFVQTTINYATNFESSAYYQNYQISDELAKYLSRGADFLLENQTCYIADIKHVIIPQFFRQDTFKNVQYQLPSIKRNTELLFNTRRLGRIENYLDDYSEIEDLYWMNFVALDQAPGKSLKINNLIKDVSKFHFQTVLQCLGEVDGFLKPWLSSKYGFNLYTMYQVIPVHDKKKAKTNPALSLFSAILEQRKIESAHLYRHFTEYALCHWFKRYKAYANIKPPGNDNFDYAIRDGVFKYLALWLLIKKLNLLKENQSVMEKESTLTAEEIAANEEAFCEGLGYTNAQKAMFYLGRVLSRVVYEQSVVKRHKKNALDKLNYNGMDKRTIVRFSEDLFDAARHYSITGKIVWSWGKFKDHFMFNDWKMDNQEALFFILSGYTFGIKSTSGSEVDLDGETGDDE